MRALASELEKGGARVSWAESGESALLLIRQEAFDLVVTDDVLEDMTGLAFSVELVSVDATVNCAVVSPLSAEAFHEASEGLGVLMQLPREPDGNDAKRLLLDLRQLLDQMRS